MIKFNRFLVLLISFFVVFVTVFITFLFRVSAVGIVIFIWWFVFVLNAFSYTRIIINDDSVKFDAFVREKTVHFDEFKDSRVEIMRLVKISTKTKCYVVPIGYKTKDGLIKIVLLSEKIIVKAPLIEKIERIGNLTA